MTLPGGLSMIMHIEQILKELPLAREKELELYDGLIGKNNRHVDMNDFVLIRGGENTPVNKTPFCQQGLARGAPPPLNPPLHGGYTRCTTC